jgi:hypothetical protein
MADLRTIRSAKGHGAMHVMHGFWSLRDGLRLWAEDAGRSVKSSSQALRSARPHPFAAAAADLGTFHPGKPATAFLPPPSRPQPVTGGLKARSRRGTIAQNWWSARFIDVLESIGVAGRLERGRTYARKGQIIDMRVDSGAVTASVQGSRPRPYRVRIGINAFGKSEWSQVSRALAETPGTQRNSSPARCRTTSRNCSPRFTFRCSRQIRTSCRWIAAARISRSPVSTWRPFLPPRGNVR